MVSRLLKLVKQYQSELFLGICAVLISIISFNLGKINSGNSNPVKIQDKASVYDASSVGDAQEGIATPSFTPFPSLKPTIDPKYLDPRVVASKASKSHLYHFTWCPGAKQIALKNQLWFNNEQEAIQTGYKLASNCKK